MLELFTKVDWVTDGIRTPSTFEYIQRSYQRELEKIISYYHNRVYAVRSNHFLCRLINIANGPVSYDLDRFLEVVYARAPYVAKHFRLTSEISLGELHNGIFYGEGIREILLYDEEPIYITKSLEDWRDIQAVKVLDSPISNLGLLLPTGRKLNSETGRATISINVPLLLLQYRCFVMDQMTKQAAGSPSLLGVEHFVHMYVLPNMLYSHFDQVVFNRFNNLLNGIPMGESLRKLPFHVLDYESKVDHALKLSIRYLIKTKMRFSQILKSIPAAFHPSMETALQIPDLAPTRQVLWAMIVTRVKAMNVLLDISKDVDFSNNQSYINHLKIKLKRIKNENVLDSLLDEEDRLEVNEFIQRVESI